MEYKDEGFLSYVERARRIASRRGNLRGRLKTFVENLERKPFITDPEKASDSQIREQLNFFKLLDEGE